MRKVGPDGVVGGMPGWAARFLDISGAVLRHLGWVPLDNAAAELINPFGSGQFRRRGAIEFCLRNTDGKSEVRRFLDFTLFPRQLFSCPERRRSRPSMFARVHPLMFHIFPRNPLWETGRFPAYGGMHRQPVIPARSV